MKEPSTAREVHVYQSGVLSPKEDLVAGEEPLQITLDGCPIAIVMRTPGADLELVTGFLVTEGIISQLSELSRIDLESKPNHALVFTSLSHDPSQHQRQLYSASSCGICGKASIESVHRQIPLIETELKLSPEVILKAPDTLRAAQKTFTQTGGLHAAGFFSPEGQLRLLHEDVGRHNAIDKVIGDAIRQSIPLREGFLQVSGRVSFEVTQKALVAQIPVITAISAPSSLAIEFAEASFQTLIGFMKKDRMNVYTHPSRLLSH